MRILFLFIFGFSYVFSQTTLVEPAEYARKYDYKDPYNELTDAGTPKTVKPVKKQIKTEAGIPVVEKLYSPAIARLLSLLKSDVANQKVYQVQIYSHSNKQKVLQTQKFAKQLYPDYQFKIVFERPLFKLRAYPFYSYEEADRAKNKMREKYSGAFIVSPK